MFLFQGGQFVIRCVNWCVEVVVENMEIQGADKEMSNAVG